MMSQGQPDLQVHFINCGQGHMVLVVMPDDTVLLCDCRVTKDDEDRILGHLGEYIPVRADAEADGEGRQWIDWFVCSHRDDDHIHGLDLVNAAFPIRGIMDSGTTSGSTDGDANRYYMYLCCTLREKYGAGAVVEPQPATTPIAEFGGAALYCLCTGVEDEPSEDGHYGNLVVQMEYAGNRVLLAGDSDWRAWQDKIMPAFGDSGLLQSTVLLASHHGSRSFFMDVDPLSDDEDWDHAYEEHLDLIAPAMTVVSSGQQKEQNHPNPGARARYVATTSHKQVYLTREKGTLVGCFYENGDWTVVPSRFLREWDYHRYVPTGKGLQIVCEEHDDAGRLLGRIASGASVPRGHRLKFAVTTSGGVVGGAAKYLFEVSNGGVGVDAAHDDIYQEMDGSNRFERDVRYLGTHLLRYHVSDAKTKQKAQGVFVVHGV